jgi:hypothetical protein
MGKYQDIFSSETHKKGSTKFMIINLINRLSGQRYIESGQTDQQICIKMLQYENHTRGAKCDIYRGYYTAGEDYDFYHSSGENNILRTSAASE